MKLELPNSVEKPVEEVITPIATGIGKTLSDLWFLALGGISHLADKKKIKYAIALEEFKKSLEDKANNIPMEHRIEPDTQIACQALEDAKYCAENEEIREMFANLIASTMDNRVSQTVHPSFSSILKQMSSADAKFFMKFIKSEILPVCNIKEIYKDTEQYCMLFNDLYVEQVDHFEQTIYDNAFIISTLNRLGLIMITYSVYIARNDVYDVFNESLFYKGYTEREKRDANIKIELQKGCMELTNLGRNFLRVCCSS